MSQRTRNLLQLIEEDVTTYHVSGTSCKLLEETFTNLQCIKNIWPATWNKIWQGSRIVLHVTWRSCSNVSRIKNAWQVTGRRCYNVSRIRNVLQITWRRCYNVSGTSCKLFSEDVTTYVLGWAVSFQTLFHTRSRSRTRMATGCVLASSRKVHE